MSGMTAATTATSEVAPAVRHHQSGQSGSGNAEGIDSTSAVAQTKISVTMPEMRVAVFFARATKCSP
jgi:hypothetical protein